MPVDSPSRTVSPPFTRTRWAPVARSQGRRKRNRGVAAPLPKRCGGGTPERGRFSAIVGQGVNPDNRGEVWVAVIPEPNTFAMLGLELAALGGRRRARPRA